MIRKEQEKLGKEIVERLNKGEKVGGFNISNFYNIKQFYYIKTEEISLDNFDLIVLPEDNEGDSLLKVRFLVKIVNNSISIRDGTYCNYKLNKPCCFTKFNLTGNYRKINNLDFWLVRDEKFEWIKEKLKKDDPEYNLAMYELYGFNEEYIRRELGYFKDICK